MAERDRVEQLNGAVDAVLSGSPVAGELSEVLEVLCDLPDQEFRARLKLELMKKERGMIATTHVREGFRTVTPYLHVQGADRFIDFLKQAFDANENFRVNRPDGSIKHAELRVGDSILEVADAEPLSFGLHMYVPDV